MSKTLKSGHSSYWLDEDLWTGSGRRDTVASASNSIDKVIRLSAVRRAISNFVSILSGQNVPVYFEGEDSYTDGKFVVIAADDNPKNFDVSVGLALHEASHILLSNFDWLHAMAGYIDEVSNWNGAVIRYGKHGALYPAGDVNSAWVLFRPEIREAINSDLDKVLEYHSMSNTQYAYGTVVREYINHIKTIMNVLEDRRIDQHVYKNAMGYRPYYTALYEKYFYTDEASKFIRLDADARIPSIDNYINHLIYHIHPDSDPDALPGLRAIFNEMDLKNVHLLGPEYDAKVNSESFTYDMTPNLWQKANDIMVMIIKYVDLHANLLTTGNGDAPGMGDATDDVADDSQDNNGTATKGNSQSRGGTTDSGSDPSVDVGDSEAGGGAPSTPQDMVPRAPQAPKNKRDANYKPAKAKKEIEKVKDLIGGDVKKKKINKSMAASVRAMEQAQGEMVSISALGIDNVNCMVTRNVTEALLEEDWFLFSRGTGKYAWIDTRLTDAIAAGRRMGQILHQRLQIRNDPMTTRQTRQASGRIERRLLANLGMENSDVFYRERVDSHKPVMLHLTIDASGSMSGEKFHKSMTVATAMAFLSSKMGNVDCVISLRGGNKFPIIAVLFDSRRDHFRKWMQFAPRLCTGGNTPEGLCFAATMDIILESKNTHDVYFINFSDGMPGFILGENATVLKGPSRSRNAGWYQGEASLAHTRKMVNTLRDNGVKILSYFIGDSYYGHEGVKKSFAYMYGNDAEFVDVSSVTNVLNTMNKLLMKR